MSPVVAKVYGGPGTGKTAWVAADIRHQLEAGASDTAFLAIAFTNAAVDVLLDRLPLPQGRVRTLHSLGRREGDRVLGGRGPNGYRPDRIGGHSMRWPTGTDEWGEPAGEGGDQLMAAVNLLRVKRAPWERWPTAAQRFMQALDDLLRNEPLQDFPSMLEHLIDEPPRFPALRFLYVDEAQDLSPLQWASVEAFVEANPTIGRVVLAGDDDQSLYSYQGVDPLGMVKVNLGYEDSPPPLAVSHRCAVSPFGLAQSIIKSVPGRVPKEIEARESDARWQRTSATMRDSSEIARSALRMAEAGTVGVLAASNAMLAPVIREMRNQGIPYGEPPQRGKEADAWRSPLATSAAQALASFERGYELTNADALALAKGVRTEYVDADALRELRNGLKTGAIEERTFYADAGRTLDVLFPDLPGDGDLLAWYETRARTSRHDEGLGPYLARVVRQHGWGVLEPGYTPAIAVRTIHRAKGSEYDRVILGADAPAPAVEAGDWPSMRRAAYVGVTRAREDVLLTSPAVRKGKRSRRRDSLPLGIAG